MLIILIPDRTFIIHSQKPDTSKGEPIVVSYSLPLSMTHRTPKIRPAMTAIAAILALSSTQLLAQMAPEATQPVTVAPVLAVPDITPGATTPSEPSANSASDPLAAEPTITTTKSSSSTTTRRTASVTRPAKAAPPVARASGAAPVAEPAETAAASPGPLVAMPAAPPPAIAATPPAQEAPAVSNDMLPIAGAAGLGLLGLIGLGVAMRRRKLRRDEEFAAADQYQPAAEASAQADPLFAEPSFAPRPADPVPATPVVAASALVATSASAGSPSDCIDTAPGSHVEAACDGPTADNPSLSIKKRLKRAHFFDQREFLAAAGEVAPMAADAGLPDAVAVPASPIGEPA